MDAKPIDYSALNRTISSKEAWSHFKHGNIGALPLLSVAVIFVIMSLAAALQTRSFSGATLFWGGLGLAMIAGTAWQYTRTVRNAIRLQRFAAANGWEFKPTTIPQEQGTLFHIGSNAHAERVVAGRHKGHEFWFGTYYYTTGSGKSRRTHSMGVLNLSLERAVPHVVIDGRQNRFPLGGEFDSSQQLELEGDFNKYFKVYCPKDYERDVLYFLTPELMQVLVDMNDVFDVEMRDRELYFYARSEVRAEEKHLRDIFSVIEAVGGEVTDNTQRYHDWRVEKGLNQVAPAGAQLKKSIWPSVIAITVIIVYVVIAIVR